MGLGDIIAVCILIFLITGAGIAVTISIGNDSDYDPIQDNELGTKDGYEYHLTLVQRGSDLKNALKDILSQGGTVQDMESNTNNYWYVYWYKESTA